MILEFTYVIPKIISLALGKEVRVSQKRWGDKPEALPLEYSSTNSKLHKMENSISNAKCTAYKQSIITIAKVKSKLYVIFKYESKTHICQELCQ